MSKIVKICLSFSLLLMVCFASCHKQAPPTLKPKILHMNIHQEPATMDPRKGSDWISSVMHFNLFEGLMRLNPDGSLTPAQAHSVDISEDLLVYTFHLRETCWSNGKPVTAQDFEMSWKKILSPHFPAPNAHLLYPIKNAEKVKKGELSFEELGVYSPNNKTLVVTLEHPTPYFLNLVSFATFFPVPYNIDSQLPNWACDAGSSFVCNGPFVLEQWKHHNEIVFQKNPVYWNIQAIQLEQIHIDMIADGNTALHMFENGKLDIIGLGISPIPADALIKYAKQGLLHVNHFPGTTIVCFNVHKFPFHNQHIRKAFAYALDRAEITQNIVGPEGITAYDIIPPGLKNDMSASLLEDGNVLLAQQHLAAGLKELNLSLQDFPTITYSYTPTGSNHALAQALQQQLEQHLGIAIALDKSDYKTHLDKLTSRNFEFAQSFWVAQYRDPMNILERFKYTTNIKNYSGWENPTYIELLEKSILASTPEERLATLTQAEALLVDEMPLIPLYHWSSAFMVQPHISGYETSSNGVFDYSHLQIK